MTGPGILHEAVASFDANERPLRRGHLHSAAKVEHARASGRTPARTTAAEGRSGCTQMAFGASPTLRKPDRSFANGLTRSNRGPTVTPNKPSTRLPLKTKSSGYTLISASMPMIQAGCQASRPPKPTSVSSNSLKAAEVTWTPNSNRPGLDCATAAAGHAARRPARARIVVGLCIVIAALTLLDAHRTRRNRLVRRRLVSARSRYETASSTFRRSARCDDGRCHSIRP